MRGADGYHLRVAPPIAADHRGTCGSVYGGKYKRADEYRTGVGGGGGGGQQPGRRASAASRDSCSLFYGDDGVDRDGYTHIWERPLPGAPPPGHVTAAAILLPVGDGGSACPGPYKCRGGVPLPAPPPPPPLPLPVIDNSPAQSLPRHDAVVTSGAELSNYYQLDGAKDGDQSPLE